MNLNSEYQHRLTAWARRLHQEQGLTWTYPQDAEARIRVIEPSWDGCDTCGYGRTDGGIEVVLAGVVIHRYAFSDLNEVLSRLLEVDPVTGG